jgi:catechol 2,3-dioxygenase-like lactoylglutathione lyase family enzyme
VEVQFVASIAPIVGDADDAAHFYRDVLGLPVEGDEYLSTEAMEGVKHFGLWPLSGAAQSCFGTQSWPEDFPVPHASVEFELGSPALVTEAVAELEAAGYRMLHGAREEPWGQTVARMQTPDGLIVGLSFAPWMHS